MGRTVLGPAQNDRASDRPCIPRRKGHGMRMEGVGSILGKPWGRRPDTPVYLQFYFCVGTFTSLG
jgi:hypothetical protein